VLTLEALERGVARCEPYVLFLDLLGHAPQLQAFVHQLIDLFVDLLLDVVIVSLVERLKEQATSRQE